MSKRTKKSETTKPTVKFLYLVQTSSDPLVWVGMPVAVRTSERIQAAAWLDEGQAAEVARQQGGQVVAQAIDEGWLSQAVADVPRPAVLSLAPEALPVPVEEAVAVMAQTPTGSSEGARKGKAKGNKAPAAPVPPRAPRGPARDEVVALLVAAGLPLTRKSSDHYGDPKSARLVLPMADHVTRIYLYKMAIATSLLGYHTEEQRKARGLGAVTHVCDVTTLDQVRPLVAAVAEANGIQLRQDGKPKAKRTRKATPAGGASAPETQATAADPVAS